MSADIVVAIAGGIGSGKSVVSRILSCMGYPVYDCDTEAKSIMDSDPEIKSEIKHDISAEAVDDHGNLRRDVISEVVFNDAARLEALNRIVHTAVKSHLKCWLSAIPDGPAFVETAILYQSGLDRMVDEVWEVEAPEDIRILRVCKRNNLSVQQVKARIESQRITIDSPHPRIKIITNDNTQSLLLQVTALLSRLKCQGMRQ